MSEKNTETKKRLARPEKPGPEKPFNTSDREFVFQKVRELYADVVNEPIPDSLQELLKKIDETPSE